MSEILIPRNFSRRSAVPTPVPITVSSLFFPHSACSSLTGRTPQHARGRPPPRIAPTPPLFSFSSPLFLFPFSIFLFSLPSHSSSSLSLLTEQSTHSTSIARRRRAPLRWPNPTCAANPSTCASFPAAPSPRRPSPHRRSRRPWGATAELDNEQSRAAPPHWLPPLPLAPPLRPLILSPSRPRHSTARRH